MKRLLLNKLASQETAPVVVFWGGLGKSSSLHYLESIIAKSVKSIAVGEVKDDVHSLLLLAGRKSFFGGVMARLFKRPLPELYLAELTGRVFKTDFVTKERPTILIIPSVQQELQSDNFDLKSWLKSSLIVDPAMQSAITVLYNNDVQGLSEALSDAGFTNKISFSVDSKSDIQSQEIEPYINKVTETTIDNRIQGIKTKMLVGGTYMPFHLRGVLGRFPVYAALSAISAAKQLKVNFVDALNALSDKQGLPSRMRLIPGIKKTLIVDDSYENSPESLLLAIEDVSRLKGEDQKIIAIIGDIEGLGRDSERVHGVIGEQLVRLGYNMIVSIGEKARDITRSAKQIDPDIEAYEFMDKGEAGIFVQNQLRIGDIVFIKGDKKSQLETVVKELMAFPLQAKKDLIQR